MRQFGRFRLVELLASGGMADVWRAEMPGAAGFVKEVALKLVRREHCEDDAFTRMFVQEARLASRLDHANIVHVFDLGEVDGRYYIAMELVRGRTVREVADRCRELGVRFGVARAIHVCAEVARALAYAHRLEVDGRPAGLVHRDVSPQNVLVSFEGEVKLADFGIARAAGADELTRAGTIKGKLAYMAPEQARGEPVDARADVFALGVVLWELLAGRRLFAREGEAATLAALLDDAPVSRPSEWNEAVPPELDAVVLAALARDRERRTASAEELAGALAALRLRLAGAPEEIDLRALLQRLWPEGAAAPRRPREATAVMASPPVPVAAEPEGTSGAPPPAPLADSSGATPLEDEIPTRTLAVPRAIPSEGRRRRRLALGLASGVAVAVTVAVLRWSGGGGDPLPSGGSRSAAGTGLDAAEAVSDRAPDAPPESAAGAAAAPASPSGGEPAPAPEGESAPPGEPLAMPGERPNPEPGSRAQAPRSAPSGSGRATLVVDVVPWATVYVDGERVGDTPLTLELPAGAHEVRAVHPRLGAARARLELSAGERRRWSPALTR